MREDYKPRLGEDAQAVTMHQRIQPLFFEGLDSTRKIKQSNPHFGVSGEFLRHKAIQGPPSFHVYTPPPPICSLYSPRPSRLGGVERGLFEVACGRGYADDGSFEG